jgi:hypothetical protein
MELFSIEELEARLKTHGKENYLFIYSVMKGVVVGIAVLTLINLFRTTDDGHGVFLSKLSLWAASFAAIIMTYYATTVGTLIWVFYPTWKDVILPFVLVIAESLLFLVLSKLDSAVPDPTDTFWCNWNLTFAGFALICHLMLWNIYQKVQSSSYKEELEHLINKYRGRVKSDVRSSGVSIIVWYVVWAVWHSWLKNKYPVSRNWLWLSGVAVLILMFFVIKNQAQAHDLIINAVSGRVKDKCQ